ncbi:STAS domain-containing protein [Actinoplanes sp. G11-F43]|uniref:STAS domain-containing protein n=1 Tax=Actinoplanes sp. G11-F43 TaxID=3424130 RepID=UPI003D359489
MTAIIGDGEGLVTVICDGCGETKQTTDVLRDEDVVWPSITTLGWTGSPFATGNHRCPRCAEDAHASPAPASAEPPVPSEGVCDVYDPGEHARVVVLRADLDLHRVDHVRPALMDAADSGRDVIVDMRDAGVIDSAGLGLLVRAYRCAKRRGAGLSLVAPSRFVVTVLHTMHLDGMFPTFPDEEAALAFANPRESVRTGAIPMQQSP